MRIIDADLLLETGSGIKMIIPKNCHPYEAIRIQGKAFEDAVKNAPTVDAKHVVHGNWERFHLGLYDFALRLKCSACGKIIYEEGFNYCPNCGARMDGGIEDGAT